MTKEKRIKVIIVEPDTAPRVEIIDNNLKTLQGIVGGYIEVLRGEGFEIIINEEGKLMELEPNFTIFGGMDYVVGTVIILDADNSTGEFTSISNEMIPTLSAYIMTHGRYALKESIEIIKEKTGGFFF